MADWRSVMMAGTSGSKFKDETRQIADHFVNNKGIPLQWDCDSKMAIGISNINKIELEIGKIESIISNWLISHPNIDGLFTNEINFNELLRVNLSGLPLWAYVCFGGTQGYIIQVVTTQPLQMPIYSRCFEV